MEKKKNILTFYLRRHLGTKNSKKLRLNDEIPAILYGKNKKNINLKIKNSIYLVNILKKKTFYIKIENREISVKVKNIQYHPISNKIIHLDLTY
ncbi:MAG: hypothetical protein ACG0KC_00960 [Enterobacteriaceae bacterium]